VRRLALGLVGLALLLPITACGESTGGAASSASRPPAVVGMNLTTAEKLMKDNGYAYTEVAEDGLLGIVNTDHWTVCAQTEVSDHLIELKAAKRGCKP
jgi:hypothetical protein